MATTLTKKAQVVLSADQYELLEAYARERGKSVSRVVRETLQQALLPTLLERRRQEAFRWLSSQELPVADWETMERELEGRWKGRGPD